MLKIQYLGILTKSKKKQKWSTDVILDLMEERRKIKGKNVFKYKELDNAIKEKCREKKETWWSKQCDKIEKEFYKNPSVARTKVKEI